MCLHTHIYIHKLAFLNADPMTIAPKGSDNSDSFYFCSKYLILEAGIYKNYGIYLNINNFT